MLICPCIGKFFAIKCLLSEILGVACLERGISSIYSCSHLFGLIYNY